MSKTTVGVETQWGKFADDSHKLEMWDKRSIATIPDSESHEDHIGAMGEFESDHGGGGPYGSQGQRRLQSIKNTRRTKALEKEAIRGGIFTFSEMLKSVLMRRKMVIEFRMEISKSKKMRMRISNGAIMAISTVPI